MLIDPTQNHLLTLTMKSPKQFNFNVNQKFLRKQLRYTAISLFWLLGFVLLVWLISPYATTLAPIVFLIVWIILLNWAQNIINRG
jgi:hypothetical protein